MKEYKSSRSKASGGLWRQAVESEFIRKVGETFATRILLIGAGLVTSVIVARILGPEGRGLFAVAMTIGVTGVQFGNMGLQASNTYYVARSRELLPVLLGNTLFVSFVFGGLAAVGAWGIFWLSPGLAPVNGLLLVMGLAWIPFGLAHLLSHNLLLGIQKVRVYNKIALFNKVLDIVLIGAVILLGFFTVEVVFIAVWGALVVSFFWILWHLQRHFSGPPLLSFGFFRESIGYGFKAYLASFFAFLVLRVDLLMVQYLRGAKETGYYSIAASMADMIYVLPTVVGMILFPKLSALADDMERWRLAKKATLGIAAVLVPISAMAVFLAKPLIRLLYGEVFLPSAIPFWILSVAMVFYGVNNMVSIYFASVGFPWFAVYVWVIVSLLNIVLNLFAIPAYGTLGAAASSLICYATILGVQYLYAVREMTVHASSSQL